MKSEEQIWHGSTASDGANMQRVWVAEICGGRMWDVYRLWQGVNRVTHGYTAIDRGKKGALFSPKLV